jgi:acetyl-CoA carboxylase/biotin carboxylase 1
MWQINAEYIKMADRYVAVPGGSNNNNYANVELIVDIAQRTRAQVCAVAAIGCQ